MAGRRTYRSPLDSATRRPSRTQLIRNFGERERRLHARRGVRDRYRARFLACLAASLLLIIFVARAPIDIGWSPVGWYVLPPSEAITVEIMEERPVQLQADSGTPITRFDDGERDDQPGDKPEQEAEPEEEVDEAPEAPVVRRPERLRGRRVFEAAHDMPQIIGGIGAYYIHIEYPEEAIREGIEGRLILSFVVEVDGRTSGVEVIRPLYPACDSAAVKALRHTRFVPGRQNGEIVPVRMRLPVRFKIVDEGEGSSSTNASL